jgi:uncharacterized hydrophobic protein (TIGR00271 family)
MLVAPLMSPILAFSLGLVLSDVRLLRLSVEAVFKGVALAVIIAAFIGVLSPFKELTGEMMARTQPTLLDLAVALASGMAGAYALAREDVSAALPGVAIAAALMPPLAVVGLGLSLGDARVSGGAFLLFVANIAAISLAGVIVFMLLGIRPQIRQPEAQQQISRRLIGFIILLVVIAIPLGIIMRGAIQDAAQERTIREILTEHVEAREDRLVTLELERRKADLLVVATVHATEPLTPEEVEDLEALVSGRLGHLVQLEMIVLPVVRAPGR